MIRYLLVLVVVLFGVGCESVRREVFPTVQEETTKIFYIKDKRTNMCFVRNEVLTNINSTIYTYVPCTPEVEALIHN